MKKVETVDQESDEKTNWQAKVFWSRRQWQATTIEQVPDSHISWKSQGTKGHVDGTVAFFEIAPRLTRVMLLMEYWPKGLFERTGNIAHLEFQHFLRYAMTTALLEQGEIEGWRGEIRDSEVVKTHEDAVKEQQQAQAAEDTESEVDETTTSPHRMRRRWGTKTHRRTTPPGPRTVSPTAPPTNTRTTARPPLTRTTRPWTR